MRGSSAPGLASSPEIVRPDGIATDHLVENVLAEIAKTLWPKNTAACLAAEIECEVRTVERYMEGSRAWSGDAIAFIVSEICKRHAMRNVRVVAR